MIKQYTVINKITDQPVRYCQCSGFDEDIIAGENEYIVEGRLEATQKPEDALGSIRMQRNAMLSQSDWTQLPDSPLNEEQKAAWAEYRQGLRDITETNAEWPIQPNV